jgi:ribosome-associated heat shock protein Hsp15
MTQTRLDKWLFHARLCRTRTLAQQAAGSGRVRLNGTRVEKPGHSVRPGDVLTLGRGGEIVALRILALAERRGPAAAAKLLYEIVADGRLARQDAPS